MHSLIILLAILSVVFAGEYGKRQDVARFSAAEVSNGKLRALEIIQVPAQRPRFVRITGVAAQGNNDNFKVDVVQFNMTTYNESTLSFAYLQGASQNGGASSQLAAFFFALRSFSLFEYLDNDGSPGFQQSTGVNADRIITYYDLSHPSLQWKPIVLNSTIITPAVGKPFKVSYVEAETEDEVFFIRFIVTEHPIYVGQVLVTADKSKIDFGIKYYNPKHVAAAWTSGPSNENVTNAKVGYAVVTVSAAFFANFKKGAATPGEKSSVSFGGGAVVGSFEWDPTAETHVQGVVANKAVYATITDQMENITANAFGAFSFKILLFSFDTMRADLIYWDPVFGANIDYDLLNASPVMVYSLTTLLVLIVALFQ